MKHFTFSRAAKNTSVFLGGLLTVLLALALWLAVGFILLMIWVWRIGAINGSKIF